MPQQISWDEFRLVKAIADTGGLNGAAEKLSLNHSTVFRRLNALEEDLGAALFDRARTGYAPTASGEQMVALARRMAEEVVEFERKVAGRDLKPSGDLSVTTTDSMLATLLAQPFAAFRRAYPDIRLNINIENRALNLSHRDADVAIRASNQPPDVLVGRRIASIAWAVYGPKKLEAETTLLADDYAGPWVGFGEPINTNNGARWLEANVRDERISVRVNSMLGVVDAIAAGLGIGIVPCFAGEARNDLTRLGAPIADASSTLWLLTHPDLKNAARVRAFLDFMATELMRLRRRIECTL
jgi:DNA-binding transcriptional LysR family regulator